MPHTAAHPLLLRPAEPNDRSAPSHPRLARGGTGCRVLTTSALLARPDAEPVTRAGAGRAHRARGTSTMTAESVARFLAVEAAQ